MQPDYSKINQVKCLLHLHLADTFIQSDLQMRTTKIGQSKPLVNAQLSQAQEKQT